MELKLTRGMLGDVVESICKSDDIKVLMAAACNWREKNKDNYKVEPYSRYLFHKDEGKIVIDFGDYAYFFLIDGITLWDEVSKMWK